MFLVFKQILFIIQTEQTFEISIYLLFVTLMPSSTITHKGSQNGFQTVTQTLYQKAYYQDIKQQSIRPRC